MAKILCIEDEAILRLDLAEVLSDTMHDILLAEDGRQGLEMIIEHAPDIVISDISMPHLNGHELVAILREDYPQFADTPFIFLSALADRDSVLQGMKAGADYYLTKPVDFDMLLVQVEASLKQVERMREKSDS